MWEKIKFLDGSILNISSLEHRPVYHHSASFCGQCLPSTADNWIWGHNMNPHIFFYENWDPKLSFKVFNVHLVRAHHFLYWFISQKLVSEINTYFDTKRHKHCSTWTICTQNSRKINVKVPSIFWKINQVYKLLRFEYIIIRAYHHLST